MKIFRTRHLRITREKPGPAHIDGDPVNMGDTLEVELIPAALHAVVNSHPGHRPLMFPKVQDMARDIENLNHDIEETFFRNVIEPFQRLENLRITDLKKFKQIIDKIRNRNT